MSTPAYIQRMNDPFGHLAPEAQPTRSPFDLRLMFNTLSPDNHRAFAQLMREISQWHMKSYNNPDTATDNGKLYGMATAAGLDQIALEIGRKWGVYDKDGPKRLPHCDNLRSWPDIESPLHDSVQIWLAHKQPTMILFTFPIGGGDTLHVRQNGHTVMNDEGHVFKPGDWIGDLLVEYARLKIWREEFGDDTYRAPKPSATLPRTHPKASFS